MSPPSGTQAEDTALRWFMTRLLQRENRAMTEPRERSWSFCWGGTCVTSILCWFGFLRADSRKRILAQVTSLGGAGNTSREVGKWKCSQERVGYQAHYHCGQLQFNPMGNFEETGQILCPVILWRKEGAGTSRPARHWLRATPGESGIIA